MKHHWLAIPLCAALACADSANNADTSGATTGAGATTAAAGTTTGATGAMQAGGMIDPNSATQQQLTAAGLDSGAAAAVIAGRPYNDMTALDRILSGRNMTEAQRDSVYTKIWKPINLNTATDQEILLIPGIGNRMLREFKEYRPYTSIEQFRREMGKYVDNNEVARMEMYVMVPRQ